MDFCQTSLRLLVIFQTADVCFILRSQGHNRRWAFFFYKRDLWRTENPVSKIGACFRNAYFRNRQFLFSSIYMCKLKRYFQSIYIYKQNCWLGHAGVKCILWFLSVNIHNSIAVTTPVWIYTDSQNEFHTSVAEPLVLSCWQQRGSSQRPLPRWASLSVMWIHISYCVNSFKDFLASTEHTLVIPLEDSPKTLDTTNWTPLIEFFEIPNDQSPTCTCVEGQAHCSGLSSPTGKKATRVCTCDSKGMGKF